MSGFILYSNCIGACVFDRAGKLLEQREWPEQAVVILQEGKWHQEELGLLEKYRKKGKVQYLGYKEEAREAIEVTQDAKLLATITPTLQQDLEEIQKRALHSTKQGIKQSFHRDLFILQCVNSIKEVDRTSNTLAKRLREWFGYSLPEFSPQSHEQFAEAIIKWEREALLKKAGVTEKESMGTALKQQDSQAIKKLAAQLVQLFSLRKEQEAYLEKVMQELCPNIHTLTGALIGAKLLALGGGLERLASMPASTIQVLGAEKALFRHIRTGSKPPKYGILHEHPFVTQAKKENKGKVARKLADKISIAARVDYFKGEFVGDQLKRALEKQIP